MRRSLLRALPLLAAAALTGGTLTPAHAAPDGWVLVQSGTTLSSGGPQIAALLGAATTATKGACGPDQSGIDVYNLVWQVWYNAAAGQTAYFWQSSGDAWASTACATSVTATGQVTDYAAGGRPPVVAGAQSTAPSTLQGDRYVAQVTMSAWVPYYDVPNVYSRGHSIIEVKVSASYVSRPTHTAVSMGCQARYTDVTPTPVGPVIGVTSDQTPCP